MNSYFDYINPNSIHIIFGKKYNSKDEPLKRPYKHVILDPRSPNLRRQSPPNLSLETAGEWEKEYPHSITKNTDFMSFNLNYIVDKSSVPILSYT